VGEDSLDGFLQEWNAASKAKIKAWAERVQSGETKLRMQHAVYAGAGGFWAEVFERVLDWAHVHHELDPTEQRNFLQLRELLWAPGKLDLALGILATPEMLVKLHFLEAPVRYRVNAVLLENTTSAAALNHEELRETVAPDYDGLGRSRARLRAESMHVVAMKGEVGQRYIEHVLGDGLPSNCLVPRLNARSYLDCMTKRLPALAVADEITCLQIIEAARRDNQAAVLLYPLRVGAPDELREPGSLLPEFPLGVAMSRNLQSDLHTTELVEFLDESLALFLYSNPRWVASRYLALREHVRQIATAALPYEKPQVIDRWLDYSFRLSPTLHASVPSPWHETLRIADAVL
jgi:hypothetical protein